MYAYVCAYYFAQNYLNWVISVLHIYQRHIHDLKYFDILDTDFDYMTLSWCLKVLKKNGACHSLLDRLENLYMNSISMVVVNNVTGAASGTNASLSDKVMFPVWNFSPLALIPS